MIDGHRILAWLSDVGRAFVGRTSLKTLLTVLYSLNVAHAHVMSPDRATLNFRDGSAYMVLSLAPSAYEDIKFDDNEDGVISFDEFQMRQLQVHQLVLQRVQLKDEKGALPLEGVFVHFEAPHLAGLEPPSIIVLGKFAMREGLTPTEWSIGLWGLKVKNNDIKATVTAQASDGSVIAQQSLVFTPFENSQKLFSEDDHTRTVFVLFGLLFLVGLIWKLTRKKFNRVKL